MRELTNRQSDVLGFIISHLEANHSVPSGKRIADHFGYQSENSAHEHLKGLEKKGMIVRLDNRRYRLSDKCSVSVSCETCRF